jgi:predicted lipoprotein with Yx(FWY)xxD motif
MRRLGTTLLVIAVPFLIAACGSSSPSDGTSSTATAQPLAQATNSSSAVVKTASNSRLGTILVNDQGLTLYRLSGEQNGKFICTSAACLGVWHPLTVSSSASVANGASLGTVKRPEGTAQVAYKGTPLYTFTGDRQPGEANGQGLKDVGIWGVVAIAAPASASTTQEQSSGGGYR